MLSISPYCRSFSVQHDYYHEWWSHPWLASWCCNLSLSNAKFRKSVACVNRVLWFPSRREVSRCLTLELGVNRQDSFSLRVWPSLCLQWGLALRQFSIEFARFGSGSDLWKHQSTCQSNHLIRSAWKLGSKEGSRAWTSQRRTFLDCGSRRWSDPYVMGRSKVVKTGWPC